MGLWALPTPLTSAQPARPTDTHTLPHQPAWVGALGWEEREFLLTDNRGDLFGNLADLLFVSDQNLRVIIDLVNELIVIHRFLVLYRA